MFCVVLVSVAAVLGIPQTSLASKLEDHRSASGCAAVRAGAGRVGEMSSTCGVTRVGAKRSLTALAESVIGLFKTEVVRYEGPWKNL